MCSVISDINITNGTARDSGGGLLIDNGGVLYANGGAQRVTIQGNIATNHNGGGVFVWGTGRVTLLNTFLDNNTAAEDGAAIFAANGGGSAIQLVMDRVGACPFLISCSEIQGHDFNLSLVYAYNSNVDIRRTIVELNKFVGSFGHAKGLFFITNSARLRLNRVAMIRNEAWYLLINPYVSGGTSGTIEATHITAARNHFFPEADSWAWRNFGTINIQNSIFTDTRGADNSGGTNTGGCNLINNGQEWTPGTYIIGTPQFINVDGGDMRQVAGSPGVDMCNQDDFGWSTERDMENQDAPVNENTNPQGSPGQAGGLYDAGVDEVYDNIGKDEFLLTVQKQGSGQGSVVSTPLGIACGSDCSEVYFNGTAVTLFANASTSSIFVGWSDCPFVNIFNNCVTVVESTHSIFAIFQPDDLIFANGFE